MAEDIGKVSFGVEAKLGDTLDQFDQMRARLDALASGVEKSSTKASKSFQNFGGAIQETGSKFGQHIADIGATTTKVFSTLATPLIGLGALATNSAIKFESSFAGIKKTVEATDEEFKVLEQQFRNMAKEIPITVGALNNIGETAGQLGIAKEGIATFTRTVTDMANTTNMSADSVANAFARISTIMGLTSNDFQKLGSTIVDLGNKGSSTESEIVNMALRIAGSAKAAGISTEGMLGLSASLANVGIRAEAGGTAMSKMIIDMAGAVSSGGERLDQFAKVAGMSGEAFAKAFKTDGAGAIAAFVQGLGQVQQRGGDVFAVLDEMGIKETRLRDAILRSAAASTMFVDTLSTSKAAWIESTALTNEAGKRYGTTASQLQVFQNKLDDMALTIGQAFLPMIIKMLDAFKPIIDAAAAMANAFAGLDPQVQKNIALFVGLAAVIGPALMILGSLVSSVSALVPVVISLGSALTSLPAMFTAVAVGAKALWALMLANPWVAVATAVAAAAVAIVLNWDKIKAGATAAWTETKDLVLGTAKAIHDGIVEWLVTKAQAIASKLQGVAKSFAQPFEWLADHLVGNSVVPDMVEDIGRQMELLDVKMTSPARNATAATAKVFEGMALTTQGAMNQVVSSINFSYGSAVQTVGSSLAQMTTKQVEWAQVGIQIGQQFLSNMITTMIQLATQWLLMQTGMVAATAAGEASKTALATTGAAMRVGITNAEATAEVGIMAGAQATILGMFGAVSGALKFMFMEMLLPAVIAVGKFIMGVLTAIAAAMKATIFGIPAGLVILAGVALIGVAIAAGVGAFASGGIVTGPTMGMIGEAGDSEAIIPLNKSGASFMSDMLGLGGGSGGGEQTIYVMLDGHTLAEVVGDKMLDRIYIQAGVS